MNRSALLSFSLLLLAATSASAKELSCSVHPGKHLSDTELAGMAKVSPSDAEKTALAAIDNASATVARNKLVAEDECLVYSVHVTIPNKSGSEKILIDAGTGSVLYQEHENKLEQMYEKTKDKLMNKKE